MLYGIPLSLPLINFVKLRVLINQKGQKADLYALFLATRQHFTFKWSDKKKDKTVSIEKQKSHILIGYLYAISNNLHETILM